MKINILTDDDNQKVAEYQIEDEWGNPLGPKQKFEGKTWKEVTEKVAAAHANSAVSMYKTKREAKLGQLLDDVDLETPLPTFEERILTADERVKLAKGLTDPAAQSEALDVLLSAKFGAPPAKIRETLQWREATERSTKAREVIFNFRQAHPEYVDCEANKEAMETYLTKHKMGITKKNLEIAYEALKADEILVIQQKAAVATASATPTVSVPATPAPTETTIPPSPTTAAAITATPAPESTPAAGTPRAPAASGSAGLSARGSSAAQTTAAPKTSDITLQQINAMNSTQYAAYLASPGNREKVDKLLSGKS
jgi:hypothetical protein